MFSTLALSTSVNSTIQGAAFKSAPFLWQQSSDSLAPGWEITQTQPVCKYHRTGGSFFLTAYMVIFYTFTHIKSKITIRGWI